MSEKRLRVCHVSALRESHDLCMFQRSCVTLAEAGYDTYLVAKGESREERGVHVIGVGEMPKSRLRRMLTFTRRLYRTARALDADIYHLHDPELLPYGLLLKRAGKRVVFDSHELYPILLRSKHYLGRFASLVACLYEGFERFALRRIDAVIYPAPVGGKDPSGGVCPRTVYVANYALKEELYHRCQPRQTIPPVLCFVGMLSPDRKGEVMFAAAALAELPLVFVGEPEPEAYAEQLRRMPEHRWVQELGVLDREQIVSVYQRCGIGLCVMPNGGQYNLADTFNMKVYDYMAMGMPVILSDSPYARRVMEHYPFGILADPEKPEEIAAAARYLVEHPQEALAMGEAGRKAIAEEFNWETQAANLLALYKELTHV